MIFAVAFRSIMVMLAVVPLEQLNGPIHGAPNTDGGKQDNGSSRPQQQQQQQHNQNQLPAYGAGNQGQGQGQGGNGVMSPQRGVQPQGQQVCIPHIMMPFISTQMAASSVYCRPPYESSILICVKNVQ
jgi:hypothetical protein